MGGNGFSVNGTKFDQLWKTAHQNLKANGNNNPTTADIVKEMLRLNQKPQKPDSPIPGFHFEHNDTIPSMKYAVNTPVPVYGVNLPTKPEMKYGANTPQGSSEPVMKYGVHLPNVPQLVTKYAANIGCNPTPFVPSSGISMKYAVNIGCNPQVRQSEGSRIKLSPEAKKTLQNAINQIRLKNTAAQIQTQYKSEG